MDAIDTIKRLLTNEYNVVYHQRSSEEQIKMWATVNPEIADKVVDIFQQEIAKARLDTARRARVLHIINPDGTGGQAELGFEVALDKTIPYSEYMTELSKTLKEHKEL